MIDCSGNAGHNVEYVLKLADWIRGALPAVVDEHLFGIELSLRRKIRERNLKLECLMGECSVKECDAKENGAAMGAAAAVAAVVSASDDEDAERPSGFSFASGVDRKKLRCVKM